MLAVELASLLFTKIKNSIFFRGIDQSIPNEWEQLSMSSIMNMIRNLDTKNTGFVNWRTFFTYITILKSEVPSEIDINDCKHDNGFMTESDFLNHSWWFSHSETS